MPPSIARDRFEQIIGSPGPVALLTGYVNSDPPTVEDDWFDCKLEPDDLRDPKQRDRKMKEMWLQALSGFANNEGGVLVWGLDARREPKGTVDRVLGAKPVADPFGLKSKLNEWRRQATDPPLGNVQIEPYESPAGSGWGFVVCYIPPGLHKPYRTNEGDKSQYYLRSSDNFVPMSSAILRAMFYPRTSALFSVEATLTWRFPHEGRILQVMRVDMRLDVTIKNSGTASVKDVVLRVEDNLSERPALSGREQDWRDESSGYFWKRTPMHPRMPAVRVFSWKWWVPANTLHGPDGSRGVPSCTDLRFRFAVYAENQEPQYFEATFTAEDVIRTKQMSIEASAREEF